MTLHLEESGVGSDTARIGFSGLGFCMGVVPRRRHRLFGFHSDGNNLPKGAALDTCCRAHALCGPLVPLFGSSRRQRRCSGHAGKFPAWVEEMTFVAGQVNCHRISLI